MNTMLGEVIYGSGPKLQDYIEAKPDHVGAGFHLKIDPRFVACVILAALLALLALHSHKHRLQSAGRF